MDTEDLTITEVWQSLLTRMLNLEGHHNVLGLKEVWISVRAMVDSSDLDIMRRFHGTIHMYNIHYMTICIYI